MLLLLPTQACRAQAGVQCTCRVLLFIKQQWQKCIRTRTPEHKWNAKFAPAVSWTDRPRPLPPPLCQRHRVGSVRCTVCVCTHCTVYSIPSVALLSKLN